MAVYETPEVLNEGPYDNTFDKNLKYFRTFQNPIPYKSSSDGKYYANYNDALAAKNSRMKNLKTAQEITNNLLKGKPSAQEITNNLLKGKPSAQEITNNFLSGKTKPPKKPPESPPPQPGSQPPTSAAPRATPTATGGSVPKPTTAPAKPNPTGTAKPMGGDPMDQWARANPTLAAKVKSGQSGYETISARVVAGGPEPPDPTPPSTPSASTPPSSSTNNSDSGMSDRLKKALDIKKSDVTSSYQWPSIKTIRDIADAYNSIYETNNDGNLANNYPPYDKVTRGDIIAGATGNDEMGGKNRKKSRTKSRTKSTINADFEMWVDGLLNEGYDLSDYTWNEVYEIYEDAIMEAEQEYEIYNIVLEYLISNHYTETEDGANTIIENMSDVWIDEIINEKIVERGEGYKGGPKFSWMKPSKPKPPSGKKGDRSGYGPDEKFKTPEDKIEKPGTDVPPPKKGGYGRISRTVPIIGPHADKPNSRVTTVTGGDPGASPSKKIAKDDRKPKPIKRGKFTVVPIEPPSK
jgi:hypothetical protein